MANPTVDILMYHSISGSLGPTNISERVFDMQMSALSRSGLPVLDMDALLAADDLPMRSVVVTFDDAFQDFADTAWPIMKRYGFRPMVYVPTGYAGKSEGWPGGALPSRKVMSWDVMRALSRDGVQFGSHTVSHAMLDSLSETQIENELGQAFSSIEDQLGIEARHFAAPYGIMSKTASGVVAKFHKTNVTTELAQARPARNNLLELPRLEMFYFQDQERWEDHLAGRGSGYLLKRMAMRKVRHTFSPPWRNKMH